MTYKQIETSREIRQWIKLAVSSVTAALAVDKMHPEFRGACGKFAQGQKNKIVKMFKKGN